MACMSKEGGVRGVAGREEVRWKMGMLIKGESLILGSKVQSKQWMGDNCWNEIIGNFAQGKRAELSPSRVSLAVNACPA